MTDETTTSTTTNDVIDAWMAGRPEGHAAKYQLYEPNGGIAMWTDSAWAGEDFLGELLAEDWETASIDGGTLELFRHRGPVLRHASLSWHPDPSGGRTKVAYLGAHCGFLWEDESARSDALKVLLDHFGWDAEGLAALGLAACEDYDNGDDGGYWLVADRETFDRVSTRCRELDADFEELDADDVLRDIRDGIRPTVEAEA